MKVSGLVTNSSEFEPEASSTNTGSAWILKLETLQQICTSAQMGGQGRNRAEWTAPLKILRDLPYIGSQRDDQKSPFYRFVLRASARKDLQKGKKERLPQNT